MSGSFCSKAMSSWATTAPALKTRQAAAAMVAERTAVLILTPLFGRFTPWCLHGSPSDAAHETLDTLTSCCGTPPSVLRVAYVRWQGRRGGAPPARAGRRPGPWPGSSPWSKSSRILVASVATSVRLWRTVVSGGDRYGASSMSSTPTTETSSEIRNPASTTARMAPMARRSLEAKSAGRSWRAIEERAHGLVARFAAPACVAERVWEGLLPAGAGSTPPEALQAFDREAQVQRPADVRQGARGPVQAGARRPQRTGPCELSRMTDGPS